ncbi:MAG: TraB/GumN family protein [Planctomycetes bacterium]|nr:TraB/GumN family protein [Planctomycetota bacterium]
MRTRITAMLPVLLICLLGLVFADEATSQKTFCWKISSGTGTVYLVGSLHLCKPDIYPLDRAIIQAYEDSEILALEADISTPEAMATIQEFIMKKGIYTDGTTIRNHTSEEGFKKLEAFCGEQGVNLSQMGVMRPWLLNFQIMSTVSAKFGWDPESGLDKHFLNRAKKENKTVKEMESATFQLEMFSSFSEEMQELVLINSLDEAPGMEDRLNKMLNAWTSGDTMAMDDVVMASLKKEPRLQSFYVKLYDERNVSMTEKIEEFLDTGTTHFVIVGCNHIPGKTGILHLLKSKKEKAYRIEQLNALGKPELVEEISKADS